LLQTDPPLVGRVEEDRFCLDPRTLQRDEISTLVDVFEQVARVL